MGLSESFQAIKNANPSQTSARNSI